MPAGNLLTGKLFVPLWKTWKNSGAKLVLGFLQWMSVVMLCALLVVNTSHEKTESRIKWCCKHKHPQVSTSILSELIPHVPENSPQQKQYLHLFKHHFHSVHDPFWIIYMFNRDQFRIESRKPALHWLLWGGHVVPGTAGFNIMRKVLIIRFIVTAG